MAMNSVMRVRKLPMPRSIMENHPRKGRSGPKMSSAWPRWVAAPRRTVISWTTIAMQKSEDDEWEKKNRRRTWRRWRRRRTMLAAVIFAEHDEDTGTDKQPQETRFGGKPRRARAAETRTRSWARSTSS